jgi:Mn-dependent DtxR family transcriptional regulator
MDGWGIAANIVTLVSRFPFERLFDRGSNDKALDALEVRLKEKGLLVAKPQALLESGARDEGKPAALETPVPTETRGTACLTCARDHLSTVSGALSEGIRFAREHGIRHPEVIRRLSIALDELNINERIDLAPSEVAALTTKEREPAEWALDNSRRLRHAITDIQDAETMEQVAAQANQVSEEFMQRYWKLAEECPQCKSIREKVRQSAERWRQKREAAAGESTTP